MYTISKWRISTVARKNFSSRRGKIIKNMYHLYILECADKTLYTGITTDIARRVAEHSRSELGAKYTAARRPVKLKYCQKFKNRSAASKAEARIKKLKKSEKLELIMKYKL
jgi:putative endonuclease